MASVAYYVMGATQRSRVLSERMLLLAESINAAGEIGAHALLVGASLHVEGKWDRADVYFRRVAEQFAAGSPSALSVRMMPILVDCLIREGRWDEARQHVPYVEARILHASGFLDRQRGDATSADDKFSEAVAIVERLGAMKQVEAFAPGTLAVDRRRSRR